MNNIMAEIQKLERKLSAETSSFIDEACKMTIYLQELLRTVKEDVIREGFSGIDEEIYFFKVVKPNILGKLIHYNKVYRIETACPVDSGDLNQSYYSLQLQALTQEYRRIYAIRVFIGTTVPAEPTVTGNISRWETLIIMMD